MNALPAYVTLNPRVQAVSDGAPAAGAENANPGAKGPGPFDTELLNSSNGPDLCHNPRIVFTRCTRAWKL